MKFIQGYGLFNTGVIPKMESPIGDQFLWALFQADPVELSGITFGVLLRLGDWSKLDWSLNPRLSLLAVVVRF